jgi:hypothetical protein
VGPHERARHRAEHRYADAPPDLGRGRAGKPGQPVGARGVQRGLGAMRAPHAEVDEPLARRRQHHARRLRRDQRLEVHDVEQPALDELCLRQRRRHAQDRLAGEERLAFGHRLHVTDAAQGLQAVEQARRGPPSCRSTHATSSPLKDSLSRDANACSSPAATRKLRCGGRRRTNSLKVADRSMPSSR